MRKLKQKYQWKNRVGLFAFRAEYGEDFPKLDFLGNLQFDQVVTVDYAYGKVDYFTHCLESAIMFGGKKFVDPRESIKAKYAKYKNPKLVEKYLVSVLKTKKF